MMHYRSCFIVALLLLLLMPCQAEMASSSSSTTAQKLTQVRWANHTDATTGESSLRLVFDVTGPVQAAGSLESATASHLKVNISGAVPEKEADSVKLDGAIADRVTINHGTGQTSLIDIGLPSTINDSDYKIFTLPKDSATNKPFRVVVDINKHASQAVIKFTPGLKGKVVVIDPGHGGSDTGAIGPDNIQEKTVTLAVALKTKSMLEQAGAKVILTRTDDRDVFAPNDSAVEELGARAAVGNKNKADVFVDIHANSFSDPKVSGIGTYYYPKTIYDKVLAQSIQDSVTRGGGQVDRGTCSAEFYVLNHTTMPAFLIELGFLSNQNEEKLLTTSQFQQQLAQGIVNGLDNFFNQAAASSSK